MSDNKTITFYDIASATQTNGWSPNTWKVRFVLNFKKIPYSTKWLELPEIKGVSESLGVKPSASRAGGNLYTLPIISVPGTDGGETIHIVDSWAIIKYLDEKYPEPPLFPHGTIGLQTWFLNTATKDARDRDAGMYKLVTRVAINRLNEASKPYFRETRERWNGMSLEEICPPGEATASKLAKGKEWFEDLDRHFEHTRGLEKNGQFVSEAGVVYADFFLGSTLVWLKMMGGDEVWPEVESWAGGRFKVLLDALLSKYGQTN